MTKAEREEQTARFLNFKSAKAFKQVERFKDLYETKKQLGQGSFGQVRLGTHRKSGVPCAIKIIKKSLLSQAEIYETLMKQELEVLEKTDHPHITRVFELLEDKRQYYVIMELISGGNLLEKVIEMKTMTEPLAADIINQLLLSLNYMHSQGITHRDLKPENLLCEPSDGKQINVKLTDFGFACFYQKDQKLELSLGSPLYMAPELCAEEEYDQRVDVWSTGVIAYILLSGMPPFVGQSKDRIYSAIQHSEPSFKKEIWRQVSSNAVDFIKKCLDKDYNKRPEVSELLKHPWLKEMVVEKSVSSNLQLEVGANLANFTKTSTFQTGVISFIANMQTKTTELEDLRNLFKKLDSSQDGFLDRQEIQAGMADIMEIFHIDEDDWDKMVNAMDTDGDGKIDYTEFITAAYNREMLLSKENLDIAFKMFDQDGNGQISMDELKQVFASGSASGKTEDVWQQIIASADTNNDGVIDFEEFEAAMMEVLKQRATCLSKAGV